MTSSRIAVDETAVKINGEWSLLYAAIDTETKLILDVALFRRYGTDPAAAFLQKLREKHDLSEAEFLVDQFGYRTSLSRVGLNDRVNYTDRNHIEKWFQTLKCESTAPIIHGWAFGRASESGLNSPWITTITKDRIKLSTEKHQSERCRTRQCHCSRTDETVDNQPSGANQTRSLELEDEELHEKARSAGNDEKFDQLWRGNISGYESQSEADMALCCLLAFWTGRDATHMDRLFRQSGLMRDKWDEVHYADGSTYGEKTIERAIRRTDDVYEPSSETGTEASTNAVDWSPNETKGTDNGPVSTSVTADTEATGGTDQAAYLAEKNQLLSERVAELEATIEQKDERIEELEAENQALRESLTACKEQLEKYGRDHNREKGVETTDEQNSVWTRVQQLIRSGSE